MLLSSGPFPQVSVVAKSISLSPAQAPGIAPFPCSISAPRAVASRRLRSETPRCGSASFSPRNCRFMGTPFLPMGFGLIFSRSFPQVTSEQAPHSSPRRKRQVSSVSLLFLPELHPLSLGCNSVYCQVCTVRILGRDLPKACHSHAKHRRHQLRFFAAHTDISFGNRRLFSVDSLRPLQLLQIPQQRLNNSRYAGAYDVSSLWPIAGVTLYAKLTPAIAFSVVNVNHSCWASRFSPAFRHRQS